MDLQNIQDQLNTEFAKESTKYIFWFDDKAEYEDEVSELRLGDVKLHILDGTNWLYSKYLLNEQDSGSKYLIYAPFPTGAIENVTSLESYVMSERAEKEITPLAQMAVVAEDKAMYDTQKSVREISGNPVEAEMEEVGKSR